MRWKNSGNTDNLKKPRKILNDSQNNTREKCLAVDFLKKSFKPCKKDNYAIDIKFFLIYYFFIVIFSYEIFNKKNGENMKYAHTQTLFNQNDNLILIKSFKKSKNIVIDINNKLIKTTQAKLDKFLENCDSYFESLGRFNEMKDFIKFKEFFKK